MRELRGRCSVSSTPATSTMRRHLLARVRSRSTFRLIRRQFGLSDNPDTSILDTVLLSAYPDTSVLCYRMRSCCTGGRSRRICSFERGGASGSASMLRTRSCCIAGLDVFVLLELFTVLSCRLMRAVRNLGIPFPRRADVTV